MKRTAKCITRQLNLLLRRTPAIAISPDKQDQLKLALVELLTNAACLEDETQDRRTGAEDESQTDC
jgi:hypothetical protein